jgi:hypothetical protein
MQTRAEASPFSRQVRDDDDGLNQRGSFLLWMAAIAVLIGLNFASWSFCMWVFGQPEHPMNYKLLTKLDKLEPIQGFSPVGAPRGKFNSVKDLYAKLYPFTPVELRAYNGILKRFYLKNYLERDDATFLSGEFRVESVQPMKEGDVFSSGLVIRARSTTFPEAVLDLALPSLEVPEKFDLLPGQVILLAEATMCAALLHVHHEDETVMVFTVVPLVTFNSPDDPAAKRYEFADGAAITVTPQERIRLDPECWPISKPLVSESPVKKPDAPATSPGEAPGIEPNPLAN